MRASALLLLAVLQAHAVAPKVHPLVAMLKANPGLQQAVTMELRHLAGGPAPRRTPATALANNIAFGLIAYRAELYSGALESVLKPAEARVVRAVQLDESTLEKVRELIPAHDPSAMAQVQERLDLLFDNSKSLGLSHEGLPVVGKEAAFKQLLGRSEPGFVHQAHVSLPDGIGLPRTSIEKGTFAGLPAVKVQYETGATVTAVNVGKAGTWTQARAMARRLGPLGTFDLPTKSQYVPLAMSAALDLKIPASKNGEPSGFYPMWLRAEHEEGNAAVAESSIISGMSDGRGLDFDELDLGAAERKQILKELRRLKTMLERRRYRTEAEQKLIEAAVDELADKRAKAEGFRSAWLNPDIQHEELPKRINAMIAKPRKEAVEEAVAALEGILEAVKDGWPVYAVRVQEPPELARIDGPLN